MSTGVKRLFVLQVGSIENDLAWNLAGVRAAGKSDPHRAAAWVRVPVLAALVEHRDLGWILHDTGFRPGDPARLPEYAREHFPGEVAPDMTLPAQLARLGVAPADIGLVIVSHMHWDHGGGLELFAGLPAGQRILAPEADFSYGLTVTHRRSAEPFGGGGYFREHFDVGGIGFELVPPSAGDYEVAEGVRIVQLEGHTPQILGMWVELPRGGPVFFPSDAFYMKRNLFPAPTPPGIVYDSLGFFRSAQKLQQLLRQRPARIVYPHDPDQMADLKLAPAFHE